MSLLILDIRYIILAKYWGRGNCIGGWISISSSQKKEKNHIIRKYVKSSGVQNHIIRKYVKSSGVQNMQNWGKIVCFWSC